MWDRYGNVSDLLPAQFVDSSRCRRSRSAPVAGSNGRPRCTVAASPAEAQQMLSSSGCWKRTASLQFWCLPSKLSNNSIIESYRILKHSYVSFIKHYMIDYDRLLSQGKLSNAFSITWTVSARQKKQCLSIGEGHLHPVVHSELLKRSRNLSTWDFIWDLMGTELTNSSCEIVFNLSNIKQTTIISIIINHYTS